MDERAEHAFSLSVRKCSLCVSVLPFLISNVTLEDLKMPPGEKIRDVFVIRCLKYFFLSPLLSYNLKPTMQWYIKLQQITLTVTGLRSAEEIP